MFKVVLITIAITAPAAAYITSFVEFKKAYNLFDLTLDLIAKIKSWL